MNVLFTVEYHFGIRRPTVKFYKTLITRENISSPDVPYICCYRLNLNAMFKPDKDPKDGALNRILLTLNMNVTLFQFLYKRNNAQHTMAFTCEPLNDAVCSEINVCIDVL